MPIQKWTGRPVTHETTTLAEVNTYIPSFTREPFGTNEYLDVITEEKEARPIAIVSKNYALIQHHEVISELQDTFEELDLGFGHICDPSILKTELLLTKYGERMWLKISAPGLRTFDPGDGHPLELQFHAMNSVDGSLRLALTAGWLRLICANGMMQITKNKKVERRHTKSLDTRSLKENIEESIDQMQSEPELYQKWYNDQRGNFAIQHWIRNTVSSTWGNSLAARANHIIQTGHDGEVNPNDLKNNDLKRKPDQMKVISAGEVPGQPKEGEKDKHTKFDLLNAITFLASHQDSLTARHRMMMDVPSIISRI